MKTITREKGYMVYIYGNKYLHRTLRGAERRAAEAQNWCHNVQIIECATGKLVAGRPE